jgi:hypothetical protein
LTLEYERSAIETLGTTHPVMQSHISVGRKPPSKHYENIKTRIYFENYSSHSGAAEDSGVPTSETVVGRVVPAEGSKDRGSIEMRRTSQPTAQHHTLEDMSLKKLFLLLCFHNSSHCLPFKNGTGSLSRDVGKELLP